MKMREIALGTALAVLAAGCTSTKKVLQNYENGLAIGSYTVPAQETAKLAESDKGDEDELLWRLLSGAAYHIGGNKEDSVRQFDIAERLFAANDTTSVFARGAQATKAMMLNDASFSYDGGGLDRVFTCLYKGIDFASTQGVGVDNKELARIEFNRASTYQSRWLDDRRKEIAASEAKLRESAAAEESKQKIKSQGNRDDIVAKAFANDTLRVQIQEKCNFDLSRSGNIDALAKSDYVNAYALHVIGTFRWLNGDSDMADLSKAAEVLPVNSPARRDANECAAGVQPVNQVWVYAEDGLCPKREEWSLKLPLILVPYANRYVMYAGMALPVLKERSHGALNWSVSTPSGPLEMTLLADIDRLVKTEYDIYLRGAITREVTRCVVRTGAQIALGIAAENASGNAALGFRIAQASAAAYAASCTAADVRSWTALPKDVKFARIDRPASGVVEVFAGSQSVRIPVPEGNSMVFIRKTSPAALPVTEVISFK